MHNFALRRGQGLSMRALTAVALILTMLPALAHAGSQGDRVAVILSNLPAAGSASYNRLHAAAGAPKGEVLDMTKAEMWPVDAKRWNAFVREAKRLGVKLSRLGGTWNHALAPMREPTPMTEAQKTMMHDVMTSKATAAMSMMALPDPSVEEYALTKGMHATGASKEPPELVIALTGTITVTARRTSIAKNATNYAWHGTTTDPGEPVTLLWWPSGRLTGSATYRGKLYAIRAMGGGMHAVIEMKPDALPPDHAPMPPAMREKMNMKADPLVTKGDASMLMPNPPPGRDEEPRPVPATRSDSRNQEDAAPVKQNPDRLALAVPGVSAIRLPRSKAMKPERPVTIRVLVAYTAGAAKHYAGIETDLIALAIEDANQSFRNSGIGNVQLELSYAYQTAYVESGSHFDHVFRFAGTSDGYMDEVHELRNRYAADVGLLIVDDANGCGLAAEVYARPERAFAAIHHGCAANMYSLAHEIGHLIGSRHDPALDESTMPFAFGHGYVHGTQWRTMMAYKDSCDGCMRLPLWSNPDVTVHGLPAGDETSNNARVIAEQAARVANFR